MDARTRAWLDQEQAWLADMVRQHGFAIQYVGGGGCSRPGCDCPDTPEPPFAYTVGLFGMDHQELVVLGLDPETAGRVLHDLVGRVRNGEPLIPGQLIDFELWPHRVIPEVVPNPGEIVFTANSYYRRPDSASVPVLQLSYDDYLGRFPWDDGHAAPQAQPRPGAWSA